MKILKLEIIKNCKWLKVPNKIGRCHCYASNVPTEWLSKFWNRQLTCHKRLVYTMMCELPNVPVICDDTKKRKQTEKKTHLKIKSQFAQVTHTHRHEENKPFEPRGPFFKPATWLVSRKMQAHKLCANIHPD